MIFMSQFVVTFGVTASNTGMSLVERSSASNVSDNNLTGRSYGPGTVITTQATETIDRGDFAGGWLHQRWDRIATNRWVNRYVQSGGSTTHHMRPITRSTTHSPMVATRNTSVRRGPGSHFALVRTLGANAERVTPLHTINTNQMNLGTPGVWVRIADNQWVLRADLI